MTKYMIVNWVIFGISCAWLGFILTEGICNVFIGQVYTLLPIAIEQRLAEHWLYPFCTLFMSGFFAMSQIIWD